MFLSVLKYNSKECGYNNADSVERVHTQFCKSSLNVKGSTQSSTVYGELEGFH